MKKKRRYLIIQSIIMVLLAALLIGAVVGASIDGAAARAADPSAGIFSRETAAERLRPLVPLFMAAGGSTAAGLLLRVKNEDSLKPSKGGKTVNRAPGGKTVGVVLLLAAAAMIAAGVLNGSARDVFGKAVRICAECVGLG